MSDKKYVGNGKKAGNYDLINISISEEKVRDSWFEYNGKKYLKLTVGGLKEPNQYGKTHTVWIDDYKPEQQSQPQTAQAGDGLPF
jgi:hypothetical protein